MELKDLREYGWAYINILKLILNGIESQFNTAHLTVEVYGVNPQWNWKTPLTIETVTAPTIKLILNGIESISC